MTRAELANFMLLIFVCAYMPIASMFMQLVIVVPQAVRRPFLNTEQFGTLLQTA